jgi:tetratricopeptide (TPR) repeat protein
LVEGWPLAIELAAGQTPFLTLEVIETQLDTDISSLSTPFRMMEERHRTLSATLDWSLRLLPEHLQVVFRALGQFEGPFGADSGVAVCSALTRTSGQDLVLLQNRHLIAVGTIEGERFFRMLAPVRQHARTLLEPDVAMRITVTSAFIDEYDRLTREADDAIDGPDSGKWLHRMDNERASTTRAIQLAFEVGRLESGLLMTERLAWVLLLAGRQDEGQVLVDRAIALIADDTEWGIRRDLLMAAGYLAGSARDTKRARHFLEACLEQALLQGDPRAASALHNLANVAQSELRLPEALALVERAEHLFPAFVEQSPHGADYNWSALYLLKASLMVSIGMGESALAVAQQAVSSAERSGSLDRISETRATLSKVLRAVSRFAEAKKEASLASISGRQIAPHFAAAADLARGLAILATDGPDSAIPVLIGARDELEQGDQGGFFEAVGALALAHLMNRRESAAVPYLLQALGKSPAESVPGLLETSAAVLHRLGDAESAIRATTSAERLRRQSGQVVEPWIESVLRDRMPVTGPESLDSEDEELDISSAIEATRRALQRTSLTSARGR